MTNQEILQQVYDEMPNEFDLITFYHKLTGTLVPFKEATDFLDKRTAGSNNRIKVLSHPLNKPPIQVGTVLVNISREYLDKLQDIERKYNQLIKSFKEVAQ